LHLRQQLSQLVPHRLGLLRELAQIDIELCHVLKDIEHGQRSLRKWKLRKDVRNFTQETTSFQSRLSRDAQQDPVEAADLAIFKDLQFQAAEFGQRLVV